MGIYACPTLAFLPSFLPSSFLLLLRLSKTRPTSTETLAFQTLLCTELNTFRASVFPTHCTTTYTPAGARLIDPSSGFTEPCALPPIPPSPSIMPKSYPTFKSQLMDQPPPLNLPLLLPPQPRLKQLLPPLLVMAFYLLLSFSSSLYVPHTGVIYACASTSGHSVGSMSIFALCPLVP